MRPSFALLIAASLALAGLAVRDVRAQDAGLYDAPIPADAGFVRILAKDGRAGVELQVGDRTLTTGPDGVSPYMIFLEGRFPAGSGTVDVAAGSFTSIVVDPQTGALSPLADEPLASPKASGIHVYNLSAAPSVTLFAPEFERVVVDGVTSGSTRGRAFGEGSLVLEVRAGDRSIATFPKRAISRRQAVSVVVFGSADAPRAVLVDDTVVRR